MKFKKIISLAFAGIIMFGFASCESNDEPQVQNQEEYQTEMSPLEEILVNVFESHNNGTTVGDSHIFYDASTDEYTAMSAEEYALSEILINVVESHNNGTDGDSHIFYEASTDEYTTMSAEDYALMIAICDFFVSEDAPKGDGWIVGERGKGRAGAIKVAMKLSKKLEQNLDLEIRVEYADDGSFTVWYRDL